MEQRPQAIEILLPDGNPRGVRIADITSRTIVAILFPRIQFEYVSKRDELKNVGTYFLFGKNENGNDSVYIGEAENCLTRLRNHHKNKDFWNYALVIISKGQKFTKTSVKYLEYVFIQAAKKANRFDLENTSDPSKPHITEHLEVFLMDCFGTAKILTSTLGFPIFEYISKENTIKEPSKIFSIKGVGIEAEGNLIDEGFVVYKGSKSKMDTTPSCHNFLIELRNDLVEKGILVKSNSIYLFSEDYVFSSPSTAAGVVLGRNENGWKTWKNSEGKTLDEIYRK